MLLIDATAASTMLAQALSQDEPDPYDFGWLIEPWAKEARVRLKGEPDDVYALSDAQRAKFATWLKSDSGKRWIGKMPDFDQPAYMHMRFVRHLPPATWLVHFTNDPQDIADNGFAYGSDIDGLHLTTWRTEAGRHNPHGDYAFAFAVGSRDALAAERAGKYGRHAVVFHTPGGIVAYHYGDEENQVVFDRRQTADRIPVWHTPNDTWEIRRRSDGRQIREFDSLEQATSWLQAHYRQYARALGAAK